MRMVVQRAASAEVRIDGEVVARLPRPGLLVLVGVTHTDTPEVAAKLADKLWRLRILDPVRFVPVESPHPDGGDSVSTSPVTSPAPSPTDSPVASPADSPVARRQVSAADVDAPLIVVSQFTLYADTRRGRRPSWSQAAPREVAEPLVDHVVTALRRLGAEVETGVFGAMMAVELVNDGPVTVILED